VGQKNFFCIFGLPVLRNIVYNAKIEKKIFDPEKISSGPLGLRKISGGLFRKKIQIAHLK